MRLEDVRVVVLTRDGIGYGGPDHIHRFVLLRQRLHRDGAGTVGAPREDVHFVVLEQRLGIRDSLVGIIGIVLPDHLNGVPVDSVGPVGGILQSNLEAALPLLPIVRQRPGQRDYHTDFDRFTGRTRLTA